ncbi:MAG: hypothetical protein ABJB74_07595 [Gemmatimonas sp.]
MALQSQLFSGDATLEAAAVSDPAHIKPGASGPHVGKIQTALILLDDAAISDDELQRTFYGSTTAAAVLEYKRKRNIVNRSYQTQADNIVGKMTMASLDSEMSKRPPAKPVQIKPLSNFRRLPPPPLEVATLLDAGQRFSLSFKVGESQIPGTVTAPQINPQTVLELRRNSNARFTVTDGLSGTVQVVDPSVVKIQAQAGKVGTSFPIKKDPQPAQVFSGNTLGRTEIIATANGLSATLVVVVKPFGGPPPFHPGIHHDHTPSRKFDEVLHNPNNSGTGDPLKDALDKACVVLAAAADSPIPLPHGPELLVAVARTLLFVKRPLASVHLEFYLKGGGKDFVEDTNIKNWISGDSGIRKRLKREIFVGGKKTRTEGHFFFSQSEYAKDEAGQDFRFAFGGIDRVDFEVDLADHLVRVWFQDRYEWHPFYPKLYPPKSGDVARDDNCVHAALVEMQDQGAADFWMKGVAEVPLALIAKA